ncbi:MAG: hypothetical protein U0974_13180 [Gemmatimonadales bacterium]|nr:hypothetical protein [Gemmatimonadales bacterium]
MDDARRHDRLNRFSEAEVRHRLFAYTVDGWSAWRVARNMTYYAAADLPLAAPAQSTASRILAAIGASARLALCLIRGRRVDLIVKTARSALRMQVGDRHRDVYFDGLLEGRSHLKMEEINTRDFDRQARRAMFPSHLDPVVFTFWGKVLGRVLPAPAIDFARTTAAALKDEVDLHISADALLQRVSTAYWQGRLYGLLLWRTRPKAVLVSDTGDYGLMIACAKAKVPVVELQHGIFDAGHPDAVPDEAPGTDRQLLIPDALASRGVYWTAALSGTRHGCVSVPVGNELVDHAVEQRRLWVADRIARGDDACVLVVTSQGLDSTRLAKWLIDMMATAPQTMQVRLLVKLHPVYDVGGSAFDELASDPRVSIVPGNAAGNVFELLARADVHLSIASACHFDAIAIGVPSIAIPLSGHEIILDAVDGESLILAGAPGDVWKQPFRAPPVERSRAFAEPGFVENMNRLVGRLANKGA